MIIDKAALEIVRTITPAPGKTAAHVEFDRSGRHALVSIWEKDGALIVYDADDLRGGQAHPDVAAVGQVQRLEQDHLLRRHQPLTVVCSVDGRGRYFKFALSATTFHLAISRSMCLCNSSGVEDVGSTPAFESC